MEGAGGGEEEAAPLQEEAARHRGVEARLQGEMALPLAARPPAPARTGHPPRKTSPPHPLLPSPLDSLMTAGPRSPSVSASPHSAPARRFFWDRLAFTGRLSDRLAYKGRFFLDRLAYTGRFSDRLAYTGKFLDRLATAA